MLNSLNVKRFERGVVTKEIVQNENVQIKCDTSHCKGPEFWMFIRVTAGRRQAPRRGTSTRQQVRGFTMWFFFLLKGVKRWNYRTLL